MITVTAFFLLVSKCLRLFSAFRKNVLKIKWAKICRNLEIFGRKTNTLEVWRKEEKKIPLSKEILSICHLQDDIEKTEDSTTITQMESGALVAMSTTTTIQIKLGALVAMSNVRQRRRVLNVI